MGDDVSYLRLTELLLERLGPVLPARMRVRLASVAEVDELNARRLGRPELSTFPVYLHSRGVVVVAYEGDRGRRVIHVGPFEAEAEFGSWSVSDALSDIADEVSEETHDRYESEVAIESGALRIWFGLVPPASPQGPWREVVPELEPIPLAAITPA